MLDHKQNSLAPANFVQTAVHDMQSIHNIAFPAARNRQDLEPIQLSDSLDQSAQHGALERKARGTMLKSPEGEPTVTIPFSAFSTNQKRFIVFMASWAGFFSPVSANAYFPALNSLAADLHVSNTLINLTLTSYMIFQGVAPSFIGSLADSMGRRPAYTISFLIYIAANIGLALQNSYAALFVLRCLQSTGSSATVALASAVVSDVATPAERGAYMGFTLAGALLGPAVGPLIGGVLAEFLGWRAIFWFLTILGAAFLVTFLVFFPETARNTVGNGSIPPSGWNMSLMNYLAIRRRRTAERRGEVPATEQIQVEALPSRQKFVFPNPLRSLAIFWDMENALLLAYNALLFAAFYDVTATIPSQFAEIYHFDEFEIGLCYIPMGFGCMLAALTNGQLIDRNFARWCRKTGVQVKKGRDQDLKDFPVEKARLQVALPAVYLSCCTVLVYGWLLEIDGPLAAILVVLFLCSVSMTIAFNVTGTLLVDFYPRRATTATAANNLARCLLGAGATGVIVPMIDGMGRGWTFTFISLSLITASPMLWLNYWYGMKWRKERRIRDLEEEGRASKTPRGVEDGMSEQEEQMEKTEPQAEGGFAQLAAMADERREFTNARGQSRRGSQSSKATRKDILYRPRSLDHTL